MDAKRDPDVIIIVADDSSTEEDEEIAESVGRGSDIERTLRKLAEDSENEDKNDHRLSSKDSSRKMKPSRGSGTPAPLEALMDFAIGALAYKIALKDNQERSLPDLRKNFEALGYFRATGGSIRNLALLYREGPISLTQEADVSLLSFSVGLSFLRIRYNRYKGKLGPIQVSGYLQAEASPAALRAELELRPPCSLRLRALRVAALGPLRLYTSGLGVLRVLLPLITRVLRRKLQKFVERDLACYLAKHIERF